MAELDTFRRDRALRDSLEDLGRATTAAFADPARRPGDIPSGEETRELLGLYARLPSEELRSAVLGLLRVIVGAAG